MPFGAIQSAIAGLQAAGHIAKAMKDIHDTALVQSKVIELQSAILDAQTSALAAQSEQSGMLERVREAEEKVRSLEAWETEKQRYELKDLGHGKFTYTLKTGVQPSEPLHSICTNCYSKGHKSILQEETYAVGHAHVLFCNDCGAEIFTSGMRLEAHAKARPKR